MTTEKIGGGDDRRYADKQWRAVGTKRALDAAQRVFAEVSQELFDYDERKPEAERLDQAGYDAVVEDLRIKMRDAFRAGMVDAGELKRFGREVAGLPKRIKKTG